MAFTSIEEYDRHLRELERRAQYLYQIDPEAARALREKLAVQQLFRPRVADAPRPLTLVPSAPGRSRAKRPREPVQDRGRQLRLFEDAPAE